MKPILIQPLSLVLGAVLVAAPGAHGTDDSVVAKIKVARAALATQTMDLLRQETEAREELRLVAERTVGVARELRLSGIPVDAADDPQFTEDGGIAAVIVRIREYFTEDEPKEVKDLVEASIVASSTLRRVLRESRSLSDQQRVVRELYWVEAAKLGRTE